MKNADPFDLLQALNLESLSEEERQSALLEVRAQIDRIAKREQKDVTILARKLALLKIWRKLVELRVDDVRAEAPPPHVRPDVERMFSDLPDDHLSEDTEASQEEDAPPAQIPSETDGFVMVRLLEAGVVRGMKLPAGITIETSVEDADNLVEAGKAVRVAGSSDPAANDAPVAEKPD